MKSFQVKGYTPPRFDGTGSHFTITILAKDVEDALKKLKDDYNQTCFTIDNIGVM